MQLKILRFQKALDDVLLTSNECTTPKGKKGSVSVINYVWQMLLENI